MYVMVFCVIIYMQLSVCLSISFLHVCNGILCNDICIAKCPSEWFLYRVLGCNYDVACLSIVWAYIHMVSLFSVFVIYPLWSGKDSSMKSSLFSFP